MVVVDRLTKERHFIGCLSTMTAEELAWLFVKEIWRLHGCPDSIVSDRGSLFVAELWRAVCARLKINVALSTAYHPETDGQTEIANSALAEYLRHFVSYAQDDWLQLLPLAEFACNNALNASTGMSPFFANKGYHPRISFGPPRTLERASSTYLKNENKKGNAFVAKMEDILGILTEKLTFARMQQEDFSSANRTPAPAYRAGDEVFLDTRNITTARPMKKLDHKFIGPFKIVKIVNSHAYRLELPYEHDLIHHTFHTSLLRPAPDDPLPGQTNPPAPPVAIDANGKLLWAMDAIINSKRTKSKGFQYLVSWRDYTKKSWEPLDHVINATSFTADFKKRFPRKLHPTKQEIASARASLNAALDQAQELEGLDDEDSEGSESEGEQ